MKTPAVWVKCPGYESSPYDHDMRDNCWTCAPYWENIPLCPVGYGSLPSHGKLNGTGYCKKCHKYYDMASYHNATGSLERLDSLYEPFARQAEAGPIERY